MRSRKLAATTSGRAGGSSRLAPPAASSSSSSYVETPCTARTSGANCDAIRPFTSTIETLPSARTKNSMLNIDWSNPSAGISRAGHVGHAPLGLVGHGVGYSKRRKLMPFSCSTASVTPTGVIRRRA